MLQCKAQPRWGPTVQVTLCRCLSRLFAVPNGMLIWVCGPACVLATKIVHPITHPGRCPAGAQWTGRWQGYDPWPGPHSVTKHTWHEMSKCLLLWTPKEPRSGLWSIHIIGKPFYQPYPSPWLHMLPKLVAVVDKKCTRLRVLLSSFIIRVLTLCRTSRFFLSIWGFLQSGFVHHILRGVDKKEKTKKHKLHPVSTVTVSRELEPAPGPHSKIKNGQKKQIEEHEGRLQTRRRQLQQKRRRKLQMVVRIVAEEGKRVTKLQKWRKYPPSNYPSGVVHPIL